MALRVEFDKFGLASVPFTVSFLSPSFEATIERWRAFVDETRHKKSVSAAVAPEHARKDNPELYEASQRATRGRQKYFGEVLAVKNFSRGVLCVSADAEPQTVLVLASTHEHGEDLLPLIDVSGKPVVINVEPGRAYQLSAEIFGTGFIKFAAAEEGKDFPATLLIRAERHMGGGGATMPVTNAQPQTKHERDKNHALGVLFSRRGRLHVPADAQPQTISVLACDGPVGDFFPLCDLAGKPVTIAVRPGCAHILPPSAWEHASHVRFQAEAGKDFVGKVVLS